MHVSAHLAHAMGMHVPSDAPSKSALQTSPGCLHPQDVKQFLPHDPSSMDPSKVVHSAPEHVPQSFGQRSCVSQSVLLQTPSPQRVPGTSPRSPCASPHPPPTQTANVTTAGERS